MATALGLHVLRRLSALPESIQDVGAYLKARLSQLSEWFPELVGAVRGRGLILGIPLKRAGDNAVLVERARKRGLLLLTCGSDAVRFVPSLTVTRAEVDRAMEVIESSLAGMS